MENEKKNRQNFPAIFDEMMARKYGFWVEQCITNEQHQTFRELTLYFPKLEKKFNKDKTPKELVYSHDPLENKEYKIKGRAKEFYLKQCKKSSNDLAFKKNMFNLGFRIPQAKDSTGVPTSLSNGCGSTFIVKSFYAFKHSYESPYGLTYCFRPFYVGVGIQAGVHHRVKASMQLNPDDDPKMIKIITTVKDLENIAVEVQRFQNAKQKDKKDIHKKGEKRKIKISNPPQDPETIQRHFIGCHTATLKNQSINVINDDQMHQTTEPESEEFSRQPALQLQPKIIHHYKVPKKCSDLLDKLESIERELKKMQRDSDYIDSSFEEFRIAVKNQYPKQAELTQSYIDDCLEKAEQNSDQSVKANVTSIYESSTSRQSSISSNCQPPMHGQQQHKSKSSKRTSLPANFKTGIQSDQSSDFYDQNELNSNYDLNQTYPGHQHQNSQLYSHNQSYPNYQHQTHPNQTYPDHQHQNSQLYSNTSNSQAYPDYHNQNDGYIQVNSLHNQPYSDYQYQDFQSSSNANISQYPDHRYPKICIVAHDKLDDEHRELARHWFQHDQDEYQREQNHNRAMNTLENTGLREDMREGLFGDGLFIGKGGNVASCSKQSSNAPGQHKNQEPNEIVARTGDVPEGPPRANPLENKLPGKPISSSQDQKNVQQSSTNQTTPEFKRPEFKRPESTSIKGRKMTRSENNSDNSIIRMSEVNNPTDPSEVAESPEQRISRVSRSRQTSIDEREEERLNYCNDLVNNIMQGGSTQRLNEDETEALDEIYRPPVMMDIDLMDELLARDDAGADEMPGQNLISAEASTSMGPPPTPGPVSQNSQSQVRSTTEAPEETQDPPEETQDDL